jgi:hypothetical protein
MELVCNKGATRSWSGPESSGAYGIVYLIPEKLDQAEHLIVQQARRRPPPARSDTNKLADDFRSVIRCCIG